MAPPEDRALEQVAVAQTEGGDEDSDEGGDEGEACGCAENDEWEPNDRPDDASSVPWTYLGPYTSHWTIDAYLCAAEEDWYRVAVEELSYDFYALYVRAQVEGSGWCGEVCDDPFLPAAPENTIAVEVYEAASLSLLAEGISEVGSLFLTPFGADVSNNLLVRVHAPSPLASYAYKLNVEIRGYDGEDECEC
ncbi:MAG: hypothetical protein R6X02_01730 [Enhygromyxa sp.]